MGYTMNLVALNKHANPQLLGVQLGGICIATNIPVAKVAAKLGTSRQAVYGWFTGRNDVSKHLREKVEALCISLKSQYS